MNAVRTSVLMTDGKLPQM